MRLKAISLMALALVIMLSSVAAQATAIQLPTDAEDHLENKARALIDVATRAEARVKALLEKIEGNETIMKAIIDAGLSESHREKKLLIEIIEKASALLNNAKSLFEAGDYVGAIQKAIEALRLFKDAFVGIHGILCEAGVTPIEEAPGLKAQGILVAANRSLERIMRIELLPNASEVRDLLEDSKSLLDKIKLLLEQGNITAASHNLAKLNKLIAEALARLRHRAEEMIQRRAEKFVLNFGRIRSEVAKRIREEGLNETEVLEALGLGNFSQTMQNLIDMIRESKPKNIKDIIDVLKGVGNIIREIRERVPEKPPLRVEIRKILENASAFEGKVVMVSGRYCGQKPPKDLPGLSGEPPWKNWWIIADETGWIYVVGEERFIVPMRRPPILEGARVTVIGKVMIEDGIPYIREWLSIPTKPIILPIPPATPIAPGDVLKLSVKVQKDEKAYLVNVTLENTGNETIVFPNAAYGIVIQRQVGRLWLIVYTPISAQVLARLEPGESRTITIPLGRLPKRLAPGTYRVVVTGWLEESRLPITAAAEFVLE
ncbi:MAG: hypothetical protein QXX99_05955 [Candidatus Bathyarchaeia archaeon]